MNSVGYVTLIPQKGAQKRKLTYSFQKCTFLAESLLPSSFVWNPSVTKL